MTSNITKLISGYSAESGIASHFSNALTGYPFLFTPNNNSQDRKTYNPSQLIPNESVSLAGRESMGYPIVALGGRGWIVAETQISTQEREKKTWAQCAKLSVER